MTQPHRDRIGTRPPNKPDKGFAVQMEANADSRPIRVLTDKRLDFGYSPLRKSYIIASMERSGSQLLSAELWKTGILGAPCEYLFPAYDMGPMLNRLKASTPVDYLAKLVACRTSPNGVFGMNVHLVHLQPALKANPMLLKSLAPVTFIHTTRRNKLAQAVSWAKALQQAAFTSRQRVNTSPLQYSRETIDRCLETIEQQERDWSRWFETQGVTPFNLVYEDAVADLPGTVQRIVELLGVENDERHEISLPAVERQSDNTNKEWIARYQAEAGSDPPDEAQAGNQPDEGVSKSGDRAGVAGLNQARSKERPPEAARRGNPDFFDRYDRYAGGVATGGNLPTRDFLDEARMRHRYQAIIAQNRGLFQNSRVLDLASSDGRWCMAALDAGATHVVGVEMQRRRLAMANEIFAGYEIDPASYEFINSEIFSALAQFEPESFDVVMCTHLFELFDPREFFRHLDELQPKHVVLDTLIGPGRGPIVRYTLRLPEAASANAAGRNAMMLCIPNHELITFMCEYFGFSCRTVDWETLGIADWSGVQDYAKDRRRTYVLDRIS